MKYHSNIPTIPTLQMTFPHLPHPSCHLFTSGHPRHTFKSFSPLHQPPHPSQKTYSNCLTLRNIAFQRSPKNHTTSQLMTLEAVPPHTPTMEISATINHSPSHTHVSLITPSHHSNAIYTHSILQLVYSHFQPNYRIAPLCIPEPSPHLKLFLVTTESLLPYISLRIRPPPEPPPSTIASRSTDRRSQKTQSTLITSFFQRSSPLPWSTFPSYTQSIIKYRLSSKMIRSA